MALKCAESKHSDIQHELDFYKLYFNEHWQRYYTMHSFNASFQPHRDMNKGDVAFCQVSDPVAFVHFIRTHIPLALGLAARVVAAALPSSLCGTVRRSHLRCCREASMPLEAKYLDRCVREIANYLDSFYRYLSVVVFRPTEVLAGALARNKRKRDEMQA